MSDQSDLNENVCVTFTVSDWAKVVASIAMSQLALSDKEVLNATIYDCVTQSPRALS